MYTKNETSVLFAFDSIYRQFSSENTHLNVKGNYFNIGTSNLSDNMTFESHPIKDS